MTAPALTQRQLHALLDILSHHEIYSEIQDFRKPGTLGSYGPPFTSDAQGSTSPSLQNLLSKFITSLPGLRDVSAPFWKEHVSVIIDHLEKAELSESYDKGTIGIRKTLATAIAALIEYPARGIQAGFDPPVHGSGQGDEYDLRSADDLQRAFRELAKRIVYGNTLDDLFDTVQRTDDLSEHSNIVQAVHEYLLVNIASFMHYTLILSPKGQSLLSLADHANKMIPYTIIKSTLKIGNVATMISSMVRVVLAKVSLSTVTNWVGWTKGADEGMNLLQSIMSGVLGWDNRDFKSRASKIEKNKEAPSAEQLAALKAYGSKSRQEHKSIRDFSSKEAVSIAFAVLSASSTSADLTETQHTLALDYLSLQLAIRDREQLIQVLCRSSPDHLTQAIRDVVAAYDPIIRKLHKAVDLSDTINDCERFISDLIKVAKVPDSQSRRQGTPPTVGDFVQLLKKHQHSLHKFLHQCAKNGTELTSWFHVYAQHAAEQFRRSNTPTETDPPQHQNDDKDDGKGAGDLDQPLLNLFNALPEPRRAILLPTLDAHADYLATLHAASTARLAAVLASPPSNHPVLAGSSRTASAGATPDASRPSSRGKDSPASASPLHPRNSVDPGPGAFLAKWQDLLDCTPITPSVAQGGAVRHGGANGGDETRVSGTHVRSNICNDDGDGSDDDDNDDTDMFEDAHEKLDGQGCGADRQLRVAEHRERVAAVIQALGVEYRAMLSTKAASS